MEIDIYRAIFELQALVDEAPLSKAKRQQMQTNIQGLRKLAQEWEKLRDDAKEN